LQFSSIVRLLLVLLAIATSVALGGWAVIRHLPDEAQADPTRFVRPQEIQSVSLDGRDLPLAALRDVLETRAGELIDMQAVARDRVALEQVLVARGYLAARVVEPRVTFGAGGAVYVTFAIDQGRLFRIHSVTIAGASDLEAGIVTLGPGDVADASRIALARQALEARLAIRLGVRQLERVAVTLTPDLANGLVDVVLSTGR
jgi:outer membrane protein assembly factor BamA